MSQEIVQAVRQPVALNGRARRGLDERIYARIPSVVALGSRALWRLSPRAHLRRAFLRRFTQSGFDGTNRGDFDVGFLLYHPAVELITPPRLVGLGFDPVYRGLEARIEFARKWAAEWGDMRFEPEELLDLGDRLLYIGHIRGSGLSSGAAIDEDWGVLLTVSEGRVIREQPFFDRHEALETAGLRN